MPERRRADHPPEPAEPGPEGRHAGRRAGLHRPDVAGHRHHHRRHLRPVDQQQPARPRHPGLPRGRRVLGPPAGLGARPRGGPRRRRDALRLPVNRVVADLWGGHTAYDTAQSRPARARWSPWWAPQPTARSRWPGGCWRTGSPAGCPPCWSARSCGPTASSRCSTCCPGLPLDGGFLVDALVWRVTGNRDLGLIAAGWCGRVVTVLVLAWALLLPFLRATRPRCSPSSGPA